MMQNFSIKLNANAFMLQVTEVSISKIDVLEPGETKEAKIKLNSENKDAPLEGWPYTIDCGLKASQGEVEDAFVFKIPFSMSVAMISDPDVQLEDYK
jgi:hypothetical protein